jgi:hypothetical protein
MHVVPKSCQFVTVPTVNQAVWTSKQTTKELKDSAKLIQRR